AQAGPVTAFIQALIADTAQVAGVSITNAVQVDIAAQATTGNVDQGNLVPTGNLVVDPSQIVSQTFQVDAAGQLTGIEVAAIRCDAWTTDPLTIEVFDGATSLGAATLDGTQVPGPGLCGVVPKALLPSTVGSGHFDLSSQCIQVAPGHAYVFQLSGGGAGVCVGNTCVPGGGFCVFDSFCDRDYRVGLSGDVYPNGIAFGNATPLSQNDVCFKLFVAP
ncbi:MAG: hypothetical protein ACF8XB_19205, partial [Planctomycetota bacterium JB042]